MGTKMLLLVLQISCPLRKMATSANCSVSQGQSFIEPVDLPPESACEHEIVMQISKKSRRITKKDSVFVKIVQ